MHTIQPISQAGHMPTGGYRPRLCENSNIAGKINALLDWF